MTSNHDIAARARDLAARSDGLQRRSSLCVSVACATTASLAGARRALDVIDARDVRAAALRLLDELASEEMEPQ